MAQNPNRPGPTRITLLALGFRPFFLAAAAAATALMLLWLGSWHGQAGAARHYGEIGWHAHEMLFGYVVAVIAGFLLTAVRNWTGRDTAVGGRLGALALLWLAGRALPWIETVPGWLLALVDLAFLPALALGLAPALWHGQNRVNRRFLLLLAAMTLANALVHAQALGLAETAALGVRMMLDLVLLLLVWVGGRVLPFFARMAVPGAKAPIRGWLERSSMWLLIALVLLHLLAAPGAVVGSVLLALALLQAVRLYDWHHSGVWQVPILWVLYTGLAWLVLALLLQGLAGFALLPGSVATHALTAGAFGVFTLGMMARVALGHTGREMRSHWLVNAAFILLNLAAALRVAGPWLMPQWYVGWILLAGLLWSLAFLLFLWIYAPILLGPRVDGAPG